jgi:host factor-I protein
MGRVNVYDCNLCNLPAVVLLQPKIQTFVLERREIRRSAMDAKPAQNIQDTFLNTVRKDKSPITIYLVSGVKLTGKIRSFDKYSVLLENNAQEQLIFKHAISTVVSGRPMSYGDQARGGAGSAMDRTERPERLAPSVTPDVPAPVAGVSR